MRATMTFLFACCLLGLAACGDDGGGDGGGTDAASPDGGGTDASSVDGGTSDSGGDDAGGADAAGEDGGGMDAAGDDGGEADAAMSDGALPDAPGLDGASPDAPGPDVGSPDGGAASESSFLVFRDFRRCAYPRCGGFWIQAVNLPSTTCVDGSTADSCYVPEIDWSPVGLSPDRQSMVEGNTGRLIVDGAIVSRTYPMVGDLGELRADAAWMAEWGDVPSPPSMETFFHVHDTGIECLVPPCFTFDLTLLNVGTMSTVSTLDLGRAGAPPTDVTAGYGAAEADALRAAGPVRDDSMPGPGGLGRNLVATQFYLPVTP